MNIINTIRNALSASAPPAQSATNGGAEVKASSTGGRGTSDALKRIEGKRQRKVMRPYEGYGQVNPSSKAVAKAIEISGIQVVTDAERDRLVELQAEYDKIIAFEADIDRDSVGRAYDAQQVSLRERIKAGKAAETLERDAWSKADFEEDFKEKRRAAFEELRRVVTLASPITLKIRDRIREAALIATEEIEEFEKARAEEFDMPFHPSNILIAIGRMSWNMSGMRVCSPGFTQPGPSEILSVIDAYGR